MSNYTKATNFATKDALPTGNALKIVSGTEIDTEFSNIETAVNTKADTSAMTAADALKANIASPTFTGVPAAPTATAGTNTTQVATTAFAKAAADTKLPLAGGTMTGAILGTVANRLSTDGTIVDLQKDGTTVGSIGTYGSALVVGSGNANLKYDNGTDSISPVNGNGTNSNGDIDLGATDKRFKDLHLSGGVYLGGTGAANKLDDYEEGTFTPTIAVGTLTSGGALYTKIGNQVTITIDNLKLSDASSGSSINLGNMPFTCSSLASQGSVMIARKDTTEGVTAHISANSTSMFFYQNSTVDFDSLRHTALNAAGSNAWYITITYLAA